jgi:hypothetical protein
MGRIFGWLTLLGLMTGGLAIIFRYMEVAYPLPIILLSLGAGCFLDGFQLRVDFGFGNHPKVVSLKSGMRSSILATGNCCGTTTGSSKP